MRVVVVVCLIPALRLTFRRWIDVVIDILPCLLDASGDGKFGATV